VAKGLPKSYIQKYGITKKAWVEYRKSLKGGLKRIANPSPRETKNVTKRMKKFTIPVAIFGGLAAGLYDPLREAMAGDFNAAMRTLSWNYSGYNARTGKFEMSGLKRGLLPLILGVIIHKIASQLGVNRVLGQSGIPFIRI